ncbi:MAG: hypothetical protein M3155_02260 [Actinomycetota bacterium]|nr:hypothetical protein [Actinomycetota bacterium]
MPTRHPRIALVRDGELDAALRRARDALESDKPDATLVRELVLAGADVLAPEPEDPVVARLVREFDAAPATISPQEMLRRRGPLPPVDDHDPHRATRILDELREDRV